MPGKSSSEKKEIKRALKAQNLQVSNVVASVNVQPHDKDEVEVVLHGPEECTKKIRVHQEDDLAIVEGESSESSASIVSGSVTTIRGNVRGSVVVSGRGVFIGGNNCGNTINNIVIGGGELEISIDVKVPLKASVDISEVTGTVTVGDTMGPVYINASGDGKVECGKVGKVNIKISGAANANINAVQGDAKLKVSGTGNITVRGGSIDQLEASVSGMGNITVHATAQTGELDVSGMGNIRVDRIVKKPRRSLSGMGKISVGN